jgi:hypothetical protein
MHPFTHPVLAADLFDTANSWITDGRTVVNGAAVLIVAIFIVVPIVKSGFSIGKLLIAILCGGVALWFIKSGGMNWLIDIIDGTANGGSSGK